MQIGDFIRRLNSEEYVKLGEGSIQVGFRGFVCRKSECGLSWTKVHSKLLSDSGEEYWQRAAQAYEKDGKDLGKKLPALCFLTPVQLAKEGINPVYREDEDDEVYGKENYETCCLDPKNPEDKRRLLNLAHHASQNGLLRPLSHPVKGMRPKDFTPLPETKPPADFPPSAHM